MAEETLIPNNPCWVDGEYFEANPWMFSHLYEGGEEGVCPADRSETVTLSELEREDQTNIMTPIGTYVSENLIKFITGERGMDQWDAFIDELKGMGDYQYVLDQYNAKLSD